MESDTRPYPRPFGIKGVPERWLGDNLAGWLEHPEPGVASPDPWMELERIKALIDDLTERVDTAHEARDLPKDMVKTLVKGYTLDIPEDEPIYPSDIAYRYNLDPDTVEEVMEELLEEGFFK